MSRLGSLRSGPFGVRGFRLLACYGVSPGPVAALIGAGEGLFIPASFAIMPSLTVATLSGLSQRGVPRVRSERGSTGR